MVRGRGRRGPSFVTCAHKIATSHIYRGGGTQPKRLKSVEYIYSYLLTIYSTGYLQLSQITKKQNRDFRRLEIRNRRIGDFE